MLLHKRYGAQLWVAVSLLTAGCASMVAIKPPVGLTMDRVSAIEALTQSAGTDWRAQRLSSPALALAVENQPRATKRKLLGLDTVLDSSSSGFGGVSGAGGRVSSAPAYAWAFGQALWLTDSGWLLRYSFADGTKTAFAVSDSDTFDNTSITLSSDARRAYLMSRKGNFYVIDTQTGAKLGASPYALGGANANATAVAPPWIDALAGRADGQSETVYALTCTGKLTRFAVSAVKGKPTTITQVQTYDLPVDNTSPYTEIYQSAPIVINGKATVGTYRRNSSNGTLHLGNLHYYDTRCTSPTTSTTSGSLIRSVGLPGPAWAPPAIELSDAFEPIYAFVPTGYVISMIDLRTGERGESPPLLVNQTSPKSGSLSGYPYGTGGVSTQDLAPVSNGAVSIADSTSLALPETGTWSDSSGFYATKAYNGDNATPIWAYLKFFVADSDAVVNGTERAIIDASIELKCKSSSNSSGSTNPAPLRAFLVSNELTTGEAWTSTNMTPSNRPTFDDAAAFTHANLDSHRNVELSPNAGNAFKNGQKYLWSAKGRIASTGSNYAFGYAHPELPYENSSQKNGQPFKDAAPRFNGGNAPILRLTLSAEGLATPTMANPVTIDSRNKRIFALNTNCLYQISFGSATYDASDPYNTQAFGERKANFGDPAQTYFHLTRLGQDTDSQGSAGPTWSSSKQFVSNRTSPYFNGSSVWTQDNHPGFNRTAITEFKPGSPPSEVESVLLPDTGGDAKSGATYLTQDWDGTRLFVGTYDTTSNSTKGHIWVLNE